MTRVIQRVAIRQRRFLKLRTAQKGGGRRARTKCTISNTLIVMAPSESLVTTLVMPPPAPDSAFITPSTMSPYPPPTLLRVQVLAPLQESGKFQCLLRVKLYGNRTLYVMISYYITLHYFCMYHRNTQTHPYICIYLFVWISTRATHYFTAWLMKGGEVVRTGRKNV